MAALRYFVRIFALLFFSSLAACSQPKYGVVKIETLPPGAEVINLRDDTHLGMTPLLVTWEGDGDTARHATVELRKAGYMDEIISFWVKLRHETKEDASREPQSVIIELKK